MGFQNVVAGNGFNISVTGMVIVFCGLMLISVFIGLLPKILNLAIDGQKDKNETTTSQVSRPNLDVDISRPNPDVDIDEQEDHDLVSIIGLVLFMEQERLAGNPEMIKNLNIWGTAGKTTITPRRRGHV